MQTDTAKIIRELMKNASITNEAMSEKVGAHPITVSKLLNGRMRMTTVWLQKFAEALNVDASSLVANKNSFQFHAPTAPFRAQPDSRQLPVFGLAAGSLAGHAVMSTEPIEFVAAPPALATVRDAYALIVSGSSMEPRYFTGDIVFINPNRPVRPGDHVVVQVKNGDQALHETWIKRYKGESGEEIITEQYNPPAAIRFKRSFVVALHRVLTVNELLGV